MSIMCCVVSRCNENGVLNLIFRAQRRVHIKCEACLAFGCFFWYGLSSHLTDKVRTRAFIYGIIIQAQNATRFIWLGLGVMVSIKMQRSGL